MNMDEASKTGIRKIAQRLLERLKNEIDGDAGEIEYRMKDLGIPCGDAALVDDKLREIIGASLCVDFDRTFRGTMFLSRAIVAVWNEG